MPRLPLCCVAAATLLIPGCGGAAAGVPEVAGNAVVGRSSVVQDGLRVSLLVEPLAPHQPGGQMLENLTVPAMAAGKLRRGDAARFSVRVTDEAAGNGITGLGVGAWLMPRPAEFKQPPDDKATRDIIRKISNASLEAGATTNLNSWFLVTSNDDKTLTLVDPSLGFQRTRMRSVIELPCLGADLAFGPNHDLVFVSLPERGEVWAVDAVDFSVRQRTSTGKTPRRLVTDAESGLLWVSDDGGNRAFALDSRTGAVRGSVEVGGGEKLFAFAPGGRIAYVAARDSGKVVRVDTVDLSTTEALALPAPLGGLVFATAGDCAIALAADGSLTALGQGDGRRRQLSALPAGCGPLWTDHDGRWLFGAERSNHTVHVLDVATNQPARRITTPAMPTQMSFTDAFAYIYSAGSRVLTLVHLAELSNAGDIPAQRLPINQKDQEHADPDCPGDMITASPDGVSVLIAAPDEKLVYYYAEGMNAAMGSFQNHGRIPVALGVLDCGLHGASDGSYSTIVPLDLYGTVDLYVYLAKPTQVFARFEIQVEPDAETIAAAKRNKPLARTEAVELAQVLPVGKPMDYRFRLVDPETGAVLAGHDDVRVLAHGRYGNWQRRVDATPDGDAYKVTLQLPKRGDYLMQVMCPSLNLGLTLQRPLEFKASDDIEGTVAPAAASTSPTETRR